MEYFENLMKKYDNSVDEPIIRSIKRGKVHKKCECPQCKILAAYYHLKNGGAYSPDLLKGLDSHQQKILMQYVFIRAIEAMPP